MDVRQNNQKYPYFSTWLSFFPLIQFFPSIHKFPFIYTNIFFAFLVNIALFLTNHKDAISFKHDNYYFDKGTMDIFLTKSVFEG
ncbi:hypothetical protein DWV27_16150 [Phocaeicola vulgatus]|nr:hypothetical protein DWX60_13250 [Phocaeicola vulgatus]RGX34363.1 hypothetical protein DWV27_16150 [Phocaeicola vulgatus]RGZ42297.1 hypothetical protein DW990_17675 [Phocaeicola vulgatus]